MLERPDIYIPLLYLVAAIPYAWLGLHAWRRRPAVAVTPFAWAMLGMSVWSFGYGLEVFLSDIPTKILFAQIEYFGIIAAPLFMLFFAYEYTGNSHLLTARIRSLFWAISLLLLIVVWTNPLHHLMWDSIDVVQTNGLTLLDMGFGPFFWFQVFFSYALLLFASAMLIMELIHRPGIYRAQISFVVLSILSPTLGSLVFIAGVGPIRNLDLTPLFFLPTAIGLFWAIIRYRLLEVLPPEHITVIKNMKDGVIILNSDQRVLYLNPTAEELLQRKDSDAIGQPLAQVSEIFHENLTPYLSGGEQHGEIRIGDGSQTRTYEATVSPISPLRSSQRGTSSDSMVILHDITEQKEAEYASTRRESIMSSISHAAEQFLRTSTWEQSIPGVLEKLGRAVDVSRVLMAVNYVGENKDTYSSLCYEWAAPGVKSQINNPSLKHVPLQKIGFSRWEENLSRGNPIQGHVRTFPEEELEFLAILGSLSIAVVPIILENQWWGFLMFEECRNEREWTSTELDAFHAAASIFGAAELRSRAEQKVLRRQDTLSLLNEIVKLSLQADDLKKMAQVVTARLGELISADGCFITLWDEVSRLPIPLAAFGSPTEVYVRYKPEPGERTFTDAALELGRTLVVEDTSNTVYADQNVIQKFPSKSVIVLPLIASSKKIGAVILSFNKTHHFQKDEISVCEQAADLLALALGKFQSMEEAKRRADTSETLRKASLAVAEALEMGQTVSHILEQLNQVVPYDSASVQLLDGDELQIVGGHGWENQNDVLGIRFKIPGDNPNTEVIRTGTALNLSEPWKHYKNFEQPPHDHIRSWLGVPLILQGKTIGLLAIDSSEPGDFDEKDIQIATEFANQVSIALENARIFRETQAQAIIDPLTKIYNRRGLLEFGRDEFLKSTMQNRKFSAIMADIDRFKNINDTYGHEAGDKVLQAVTQQFKNGIREIDLIGRYGGEEIIILLPDTDITAGYAVANRLRKAIEDMPIAISEELEIHVTASLGVACRDENTTSLDIIINRADQAMYISKHKGRNRVSLST